MGNPSARSPATKKHKLPNLVTLVLDERSVNLLRYYQMLEDELNKPQKKQIYVTSMLAEQSEKGHMLVERLAWLFREQYPRSKFIWGAMKRQRELPDKMPRYKGRMEP